MRRGLEESIFERDKNTCNGCRLVLPTKFEVKHPTSENYLVVDHRNGRSNDPSNLQALCMKCNSSKAGKGGAAFDLSVALKTLGQCVAYYPSLARVMGIKESIFLCQLIYWTPKGRHEKGEGWIYKSVEEMDAETGLSYKEQIRVRKSLVDQGLIEEFYERNEHRLYFKVLSAGLKKKGDQLTNGHMPEGQVPDDQKEAATLPTVSSYKEQESTQETTHVGDVDKAIEMVYSIYPRKIGKLKGLQRIKEASKRIAKDKKITQIEALRRLFTATKLFAEKLKREARSEEMTPHPASWYHGGYYDEFLDVKDKPKVQRVSPIDEIRKQRGAASA
jgi:hypothetical protein